MDEEVRAAALAVIGGCRAYAATGRVDTETAVVVERIVTGLDYDALVVLVGFLGGMVAALIDREDDPEEMMDRIRYGEVG